MSNKRICKHCNEDIEIRNPSGFCDHLYYPDNCDFCREPTPIQISHAELTRLRRIEEVARELLERLKKVMTHWGENLNHDWDETEAAITRATEVLKKEGE